MSADSSPAIIFDFDGTIADTLPLIAEVMYAMAPRTKRLLPEEVEKLRELPLLDASRRFGLPWYRLPRQMFSTRHRLKAHMTEVQPFEGVIETLAALHNAGCQLFILSSNYRENIDIFLRHHKIDDYFSSVENVYYATTRTKARALRRIMRVNQLQPDRVYHVGNELLDMQAAKRAGVHGVAAVWGGYNRAALEAQNPYAMADQPKDLLTICR